MIKCNWLIFDNNKFSCSQQECRTLWFRLVFLWLMQEINILIHFFIIISSQWFNSINSFQHLSKIVGNVINCFVRRRTLDIFITFGMQLNYQEFCQAHSIIMKCQCIVGINYHWLMRWKILHAIKITGYRSYASICMTTPCRW